MPEFPKQTYLGDGAYAEYDGQYVIIYTSDGIRRTNEVVLGSIEVDALCQFINATRIAEVR